MERGEREDLYISRFMSQLKRFALDKNISIHLVHQITARKGEDGRYPKPDINSQRWWHIPDKADNCLFIGRPDRAIDFSSTSVIFGSQKIKKQKLVGTPQEIHGINFDVNQRYMFNNTTPFTDIDAKRS